MTKTRKIAEFKRKSELYTLSWTANPKTIRIGEYDVPLPRMPKKSEMENFHLPRRQQRFRKTIVPRDLQFWDKRDEDAFVEAEFHKRKHGVWYLINGKPIYLTGKAYMFFNYWHIEAGGLPEFRMEAVEFFLFWDMVERDPNCYGMDIFKPRRIGDTEKVVFILAEYATRVRNSQCGMQALVEADAYKNYKRLVNGVNKLPYFFKPVNKGTSDPEKKLEFKYPAQIISRKKLEESNDEPEYVFLEREMDTQALESQVNYETTKLKRYDSNRLGRYYMDEFGKMTEMDPVKQWGILKPTMHLYSGKLIIGKAIFTSTVEDFKDGKGNSKTMDQSKKIWDGSDPNRRDKNGRTSNGLYRLFRDALLTAPVDRFGFHKKQEMKQFILNEREDLIAKGFIDDYADFCRRAPLTIEDVFTTPASECALLPGLLDRRTRQIELKLNPDQTVYTNPSVKGDLVWRDNIFGGNVDWVPNPNGRWTISQHPVRPNHKEHASGIEMPGNRRLYSLGVDPVDNLTDNGKGSDFGMAVFRREDRTVDTHVQRDDKGVVVLEDRWKMQTNKFVCTFKYRHDDPYDGYEDFLKTAIYYGVSGHVENNKPGVINWTRSLSKGKYFFYIKNRPPQTHSTPVQTKEAGTPASGRVINQYVDALKFHVKNYIDTYDHVDQLQDYRRFKVSNRSECDLTVASGYAVLDAFDNIAEIQEEKKNAWSTSIWTKYKKVA